MANDLLHRVDLRVKEYIARWGNPPNMIFLGHEEHIEFRRIGMEMATIHMSDKGVVSGTLMGRPVLMVNLDTYLAVGYVEAE